MSEWESILRMTEVIPSSGTYDIDKVTGSGNPLGGEDRWDTETWAQERLDRIDADAVRNELRNDAYGIQ